MPSVAIRRVTATMRSFCKLDFVKYQGGSLQVELQPNFFPADSARADLVEPFATSFFQMGGVQINLNVISMQKLHDAMARPDLPAVAAYYDRLDARPGFRAHGRNGMP